MKINQLIMDIEKKMTQINIHEDVAKLILKEYKLINKRITQID